MAQARISNKYQVVIPREIRESLKIRKGQDVLITAHNGIIEIVPKQHISELRGFLAGMSSDSIREENDRF